MEKTGVYLKQPMAVKLPGEEDNIVAWRQMRDLESSLADYTGAAHCVTTFSGTTGLMMALRAAGVRDGDGVLCSAFSFFATAEIIVLSGAVPVLVDTNPNTFCIDPYCLEYVLKKCTRTKQPMPRALVAADLFGVPCQFDAISDICERYGVEVIEDMSGAFGALYNGQKTGNFGRFSVASFFPARPLGGIGDGGGIFCRTREDAELLEHLRDTGYSPHAFDMVEAEVISEKLKIYDEELARRQVVAARYRDNFSGYVKVQQVPENCESAYTQFVIALADCGQRERVMDALREKHIPCSVLHCVQGERLPKSEWERVILTNTQTAAQRLLALPMHAYLSNHVIDYICESVMETVERHG